MSASLVGSEMCIRDSSFTLAQHHHKYGQSSPQMWANAPERGGCRTWCGVELARSSAWARS
eukprot:471840-Alexandrium_andersonii.AAC.1